jgi:hypothetical protein
MNDDDLRDLFAGLALMGNLASNTKKIMNSRACAEYCYALADAMLDAKYAEPERGSHDSEKLPEVRDEKKPAG